MKRAFSNLIGLWVALGLILMAPLVEGASNEPARFQPFSVSTNQTPTRANCAGVYNASAALNFTLPTGVDKSCTFRVDATGGVVTILVAGGSSLNGGSAGVGGTVPLGMSTMFYTSDGGVTWFGANLLGSNYKPGWVPIASLPGSTMTDKLLYAVGNGYRNVQLANSFNLTFTVGLPSSFNLDCGGYTITNTGNFDMFQPGDSSVMKNCTLDGGGFSGTPVRIVAGNSQRLENVNISNSNSYNLNIEPNVGTGFTWDGGSYCAANPAVTLTTNATTAAGNAVLHFASGPPATIHTGDPITVITNTTSPSVIPGNATITAIDTSAHTVTMSQNATGAGVGNGDSIVFRPLSVKLPDSELATGGLRTFTNLHGHGCAGIYFAGGNRTIFSNSDAAAVLLNSSSRYVSLINDRLPLATVLDGTGAWVRDVVWGTPPTIASGATYADIKAQPFAEPINNSGNSTNSILPAIYTEPLGYIGGLSLSNDGTSPNTILDISAGQATDSTGAVKILLSAFTKSVSGAWASGTGQNGMGNGLTVANSTWYHVCLAYNAGAPDVYFDTAPNCANRPTGITDTQVRRIGSFKTDGSANIVAFTQSGDEFLWTTPVMEVNAGTLADTNAHDATLNGAPNGSGLKVTALLNVGCAISTSAATTRFYVSPKDIADIAPGVANGTWTQACGQVAGVMFAGQAEVRATNGTVRLRTDNNTNFTYFIGTRGWVDRRGRND